MALLLLGDKLMKQLSEGELISVIAIRIIVYYNENSFEILDHKFLKYIWPFSTYTPVRKHKLVAKDRPFVVAPKAASGASIYIMHQMTLTSFILSRDYCITNSASHRCRGDNRFHDESTFTSTPSRYYPIKKFICQFGGI